MYNFIIKMVNENFKGYQQYDINAKNFKEAILKINEVLGEEINNEDIVGIEVKEIEKEQGNESND